MDVPTMRAHVPRSQRVPPETMRQAMSPEELRALYESASTPEEAARLLSARGRHKAALLVHAMGSSPAREIAELLRSKADLIDMGVVCGGWFNAEEMPNPSKAIRIKTSAALRWSADVFDRYALKQLPIEPIIITNELERRTKMTVSRETRRRRRGKWT